MSSVTPMPDWSPALSVGHPDIDAQHKALLELGRQVDDLARGGVGGEARQRFHALLNDLAIATRVHFEAEEAVLAKNGCPNLAAHRKEHDAYLVALMELLFKATQNDLDNEGLRDFVGCLVYRHVMETDRRDKDYMQENRD